MYIDDRVLESVFWENLKVYVCEKIVKKINNNNNKKITMKTNNDNENME